MSESSASNPLSERARLTVDVPLSVYLEMVRRSKGRFTKASYVTAALTHYMSCQYTGVNIIEQAIAHAESKPKIKSAKRR